MGMLSINKRPLNIFPFSYTPKEGACITPLLPITWLLNLRLVVIQLCIAEIIARHRSD